MKKAGNFLTWVTNPQRTNDELFTVELLLERMRCWQHWPFRDRSLPFDQHQAAKKERMRNPAYRPSLPLDELEALQERADTVTYFAGDAMSDRPVRDVTALPFFPALVNLHLTHTELADLSPLGHLPEVDWLTLMEKPDFVPSEPWDFAQLGAKPKLAHVHLSLRQPWPNLAAIATWPAAREFIYNGNLLALEEVETLPGSEMVRAQKWVGAAVSLRNLKRFPAMPKVKRLHLEPTASLAGIERYPTLLNLEIGGEFTDLTPLEALANVTFLKLTSEHFTDLGPLTRMPKLRELVFVREKPIDLSKLTDAPQLRRVAFERCATMRTEVAALNAGLPPEADDFLAETQRPLGRLKFYLIDRENELALKYQTGRSTELREMRDRYYAGDEALEKAEARCFLTNLFAELTALLGPRWGFVQVDFATKAGHVLLAFRRYKDTIRIREIIDLLRRLSARARFPWTFDVSVEPHGDMSYDLEQLDALEAKAKEPAGHWAAEYTKKEFVLEENEEYERQQRERYEQLEREHLHNLQQQAGEEPFEDLSLLAAAGELDDEDDDEEEEDEMEDLLSAADSDDDESGRVALAPPPPAPPGTEDLSEQLSYWIQVLEDCLLTSPMWAERARYGLGENPVPWTPES